MSERNEKNLTSPEEIDKVKENNEHVEEIEIEELAIDGICGVY